MARLARGFGLAVYYGFARFLPPTYLPLGGVAKWLRRSTSSLFLGACGEDVTIESRVYLGSGRRVKIGDGSGIGRDSYVEGITIGSGVMVGPELLALNRNHVFTDPNRPIGQQGCTEPRPPQVGDGSWIGARVTLLPGVRIGRFCVIGAGSVVAKDVPDYSVAVGNPARVVRAWNEAEAPAQ